MLFNNKWAMSPIDNPLVDSLFVIGESEGTAVPPGNQRFIVTHDVTPLDIITNNGLFLVTNG